MSDGRSCSLDHASHSESLKSIGQTSSTSQGSVSLEAVQVVRERLFAYETQFHDQLLAQQKTLQLQELRLKDVEAYQTRFHDQLLAQQKTLQLQELRLKDVEAKLNINGNGHSNGLAASSGFEKFTALSTDGIPEVQEQGEHHDATFEQLKSKEVNKIAANQSAVLDRVAAVEARQKTLEDEHEESRRRQELMSSTYSKSAVLSLTPEECSAYMKHLHAAPQHELAYSVWDLLFFLGTSELRLEGTLMGGLMLAINIFLQLGFVAVCNLNFMTPDITSIDVEAAKHFRYTFSHDQRFMDYHSKASLATRLCDADTHPSLQLETAAFQRTVLSDVEDFLKLNEPWIVQLLNGQFMCLLAMGCWALTVNREFRSIVNFCSAIFHLPRRSGEKGTRISLEKMPSGDGYKMEFEYVDRVRIVALIVPAIIRTFIAVNLLICGCIWLASTMQVDELLLNAIALEFIMQLDELVFDSLAPSHARAILEKFEPLRCARVRHYHGVEMKSVGGVIMVPLVMVVFYFWKTVPMVQNMEAVVDELCREPRGFTYGSDAFGFVYLSSTNADNIFSEITCAAVDEALQTRSSEALSQASLQYSFDPRKSWTKSSIQEMLSTSTAQLVDTYNPSCTDLLNRSHTDTSSPTLALYAQEVYGHLSCGQQSTRAYCVDFDSLQGLMVRALCPQTCGCDSPLSLLPVDRNSYGCPSSCLSSQKYERVRGDAACYNQNVVSLTSTDYWQAWVAYARVYETAYEGVADALEHHGCNFASNFSNAEAPVIKQHLCKGTLKSGLKSIAIACPASCKCDKEDLAPSWCAKGPSSQFCLCRETMDRMMTNSARPKGDCEALICKRGELHTIWNQADGYVDSIYERLLVDEQRLDGLCFGSSGSAPASNRRLLAGTLAQSAPITTTRSAGTSAGTASGGAGSDPGTSTGTGTGPSTGKIGTSGLHAGSSGPAPASNSKLLARMPASSATTTTTCTGTGPRPGIGTIGTGTGTGNGPGA